MKKFGRDTSLDDLLDEKFGPPHETIGEVSRFCRECKTALPCVRTAIWSLPKILIVHLSRNKSVGVKVETKVTFPRYKFDLCKRISGPKEGAFLYDLKAITEHGGTGRNYYVGQGHFTAKVRLCDDEWRLANDTLIQHCEHKDVVTNKACVLYYERQDSLIGPC